MVERRTSPLPHPASHRIHWVGGRVGERAGAAPEAKPKVWQTLES